MTHDLLRSFGVLVLLVAAYPQDVPKQARPKKEIVSFTFANSKSTPSEYTIQIGNDCVVTYTEKGGDEDEELVEQPGDDDDDEASPRSKTKANIVEEREEKESAPKHFPLSVDACAEVFALAHAANDFNGDFEFHKHRVAYTGDRILGYFAPGVSHKTAFTWSENPNIQKLAAFFEGTVATLEASPKLEKAYKFDKLGLNELLKGLENQASNGYLQEMWLLGPVLNHIANDPKVMNIARQRAQRLMDFSRHPSSTPKK